MTLYLDLDRLTEEQWRLFVQRGKRAQEAVNEILESSATPDPPGKPTPQARRGVQERRKKRRRYQE